MVAALAVGPALAGCGPDKNDALSTAGTYGVSAVPVQPDNEISGDEREWAIHVTSQVAKAGKVTFTMTNYGSTIHEMLVTKTDIALGQIPLGSDGKFNEDSPDSKVVDEISEFDPGTTKSATFNLPPGKYQLVCNVPNHYKDGMYLAFEIVP
jgi:hypothetical protein